MAKGIEHRSHSTIRTLNVDKDTKHDSLTANVSTLDSQSSEERTYYICQKENEQTIHCRYYETCGTDKKNLMHQSFETPEPPHSGLSGAFTCYASQSE